MCGLCGEESGVGSEVAGAQAAGAAAGCACGLMWAHVRYAWRLATLCVGGLGGGPELQDAVLTAGITPAARQGMLVSQLLGAIAFPAWDDQRLSYIVGIQRVGGS